MDITEKNDSIFDKIAQALLVDYSGVYYVNAITNEYRCYSSDRNFHSLRIMHNGDDFFKSVVKDVELVVYEEDRHLFQTIMQKEKLLEELKKDSMQSFEYRLMIDGKPVYHTMRLIRGMSDTDDYFIFGVKNIDKHVRERQAAEKLEKEKLVLNQIARGLADHFDVIYYVDTETGDYFEFSSNGKYKTLHVPVEGKDFFTESRKNVDKYVYPDDRKMARDLQCRENMLLRREKDLSFTTEYRMAVDGNIVNIRYMEMWAEDMRHIIICIENINAEVSVEKALEQSIKKNTAYGQIAASLASHYDLIYYVDYQSGAYSEFTSNSFYGDVEIKEDGQDFFEEALINADQIVHPDDRFKVLQVLTRDYLSEALKNKKQYSIDYRLIINDKPQFTRFTVMWSNDRLHFIIGVENIDDEIKKEQERLKALDVANAMARRDELTGTKNKNAYHELEKSVQEEISRRAGSMAFAIVICDINDLKLVNDTLGHKTGDKYIKSACSLICDVFAHSPVFRVGGDEFVAYLTGRDYSDRRMLLEKLRTKVRENMGRENEPILASGMSEFDPENDQKVSQVFDRADRIMYENKRQLKEDPDSYNESTVQPGNIRIPEEDKRKLDSIFEALSIVAETGYVFLCNMKYDYSRWSQRAVDSFGLPSSYMYGAGDIWEEHIHPEDRQAYHDGIGAIFAGESSGHDLQYRARRKDGSYDLCTCHGIVLRTAAGEPLYFGGAIRNHGMHDNIDPLTGLPNQYGFFEDLQNYIDKAMPISVIMIGISKFSETNEMYGYHFGNSVLQRFGRYLLEFTGRFGTVYRLDGTKFAVITTTKNPGEIRNRYEKLRRHFRSGFVVQEKRVMLDLNAGMISAENFGVDNQTVYSCLNFSYVESKQRRQGDLVEFYNDLNDENRQRIEKISAIRSSITNGFAGFYLLYQPVVSAETEEVTGAEALLRWRNDDYGIVPPDHFIPIIEKDPLFCELGRWILVRALTDGLEMLKKYPDITINVNLSYSQIEKPDFAETVMNALLETGFPSEHLCLEITERCRLLDMDLLKNVITVLRAQGIKIALDDFGTGFSSIGVLKSLPFDTIKIDRCFVSRIVEDEKEREVIGAIAVLASSFGLNVCAEGIENVMVRDILRGFNIQSFQGYLYAKPISIADFMKWEHGAQKS